MNDLKDLYEKNADFKSYVDAYSKQYIEGRSIPVEEALTHEMVREYARWILQK